MEIVGNTQAPTRSIPPGGLPPDEYAGSENAIEEPGATESVRGGTSIPGARARRLTSPASLASSSCNDAEPIDRSARVAIVTRSAFGSRRDWATAAAMTLMQPSTASTSCAASARAEVRTLCDELRKRDPERRRVENQAVDEMGDVVDGIGQNPSRHDQSSVGGSVLDELDEPLDVDRFEQVGVVDDDGGIRHVRLVGDRPELATEPNRAGRCRLAQQPGLAEPRGRLDHYERGRGGVSEPCEQCRSWKTHRSSDQSVVVVLWTAGRGLSSAKRPRRCPGLPCPGDH